MRIPRTIRWISGATSPLPAVALRSWHGYPARPCENGAAKAVSAQNAASCIGRPRAGWSQSRQTGALRTCELCTNRRCCAAITEAIHRAGISSTCAHSHPVEKAGRTAAALAQSRGPVKPGACPGSCGGRGTSDRRRPGWRTMYVAVLRLGRVVIIDESSSDREDLLGDKSSGQAAADAERRKCHFLHDCSSLSHRCD